MVQQGRNVMALPLGRLLRAICMLLGAMCMLLRAMCRAKLQVGRHTKVRVESTPLSSVPGHLNNL